MNPEQCSHEPHWWIQSIYTAGYYSRTFTEKCLKCGLTVKGLDRTKLGPDWVAKLVRASQDQS